MLYRSRNCWYRLPCLGSPTWFPPLLHHAIPLHQVIFPSSHDKMSTYYLSTHAPLQYHFRNNREWLFLHWGFTLSLLGIHFIVIGDSPNFIPNKNARKFQWNKKSAFFTFFPWKNLYLKNITYLCTRKVRYAFYVCYIYNKTQWNGLPVRVVHLFMW